MPWVLPVAMAAAALVKSEAVDKPREDRQRKLAAATQRYSPWTGLKAGNIQEASPFSDMLQYGTQGAALGQSMDNASAQQGLMKAQSDWLKNGGSPQSGAAMTNMGQGPTQYNAGLMGWGNGFSPYDPNKGF